MGPKKKGKKGKGKKGKVKADPGWARTIQWGTWSRPYESMPSAAVKAAFGAIRVDFLAAVKEKVVSLWKNLEKMTLKCLQLDMIWSKTLAEDFLVELFSVPRPNLEFFCIRGAYLLKRFVLSPYEVLTRLKRLDIGCMDDLEFVLIQCKSLEWLSLARSKSLTKALIEAQNLQELVIDNCLKLASLMVWSSQLTSLTGLDDSKELQVLFLDCPALVNFRRPDLYVKPKPKVFHPTLLALRKWEDKQMPIPEQEFGLLPEGPIEEDDSLRDDIVYPNNPRLPRTHLQGF